MNYIKISHDLMTQINILRQNPLYLIPYLNILKKQFDGFKMTLSNQIIVITKEGVNGILKAIEFLKQQHPLPPLKSNPFLSSVCQEQAQITGFKYLLLGENNNYEQGIVQDLISKIRQQGELIGEYNCSVCFGFYDPIQILCDLIIDDGNSQKCNRLNIFNEKYSQISIGISKDQNQDFVCYIFYNTDYNQNTDYDYQKLSHNLFEQINDIRQNPVNFIQVLKNMLKRINKMKYEKNNGEVIDIVDGNMAAHKAIDFLYKQTPLPKLELNHALNQASYSHAYDLGINSLYQHESSNGQNLLQRVQKFKYYFQMSQLIDVGNYDTNEIIIMWMIGYGDEDNQHRNNIFSDQFQYIGVGSYFHKQFQHVVVVNFAGEEIHYRQSLQPYQINQNNFLQDDNFEENDDLSIPDENNNEIVNKRISSTQQYNNKRASNFNKQ